MTSRKDEAVAGAVWACEANGQRPPAPGDLSIVTDWAGHPLCVIETLHTETVPFHSVSAEFAAVDKVIRATTLEKFGPVRSVRPTLVFELGFEGIGPSPRHKSGIAVRFPRMLRVRHDKPLHEADTLPTLRSLFRP